MFSICFPRSLARVEDFAKDEIRINVYTYMNENFDRSIRTHLPQRKKEKGAGLI